MMLMMTVAWRKSSIITLRRIAHAVLTLLLLRLHCTGEQRFAAVMTFIHLLYGRAPAYIDEVTKAYEGAKDEGEEWRFVGAMERALTSEKTGEVRRDLMEQWGVVWRNAKGLHGAGGASGSSSAGASVVPATQLTELQKTELQEAAEALAARVKGRMSGKGRRGDVMATVLDVMRAATNTFTDLEREPTQTQMPPPPSRSSTPVVPMSPPAASAPVRPPAAALSSSPAPTQSPTPRRSARHTLATSAGASSSSAPMSAPRRSPRLASPRSAASSTRDVIEPPPKCKCGRPKVRIIDFIEHESFRGTYAWYLKHQDELPQNRVTDMLRRWLGGDTSRVLSTCVCRGAGFNMFHVCQGFIYLELRQLDRGRLDDDDFAVLGVNKTASDVAGHLEWLDANVEDLKQAWWYKYMADYLRDVMVSAQEFRAAPKKPIETCVDIDVFKLSRMNRYLQIVDREIAVDC